jgi:thioredoxin 2
MAEPLYVVCPTCDAINRVPPERLSAGGRCGKCHGPLFTGRPLPLTESRADRHLDRSSIPLLVDFWAGWCAPCKIMAPIFEEAATMLEPHVRLAKVDTEHEPGLAKRYAIRGIPTLILFKHGREAARIAGARDLQSIVAWTRQQL